MRTTIIILEVSRFLLVMGAFILNIATDLEMKDEYIKSCLWLFVTLVAISDMLKQKQEVESNNTSLSYVKELMFYVDKSQKLEKDLEDANKKLENQKNGRRLLYRRRPTKRRR